MDELNEKEWKGRFVAAIVKHDAAALPYAEDVADDYYNMRDEYDSPEEAAESDIEYWEL